MKKAKTLLILSILLTASLFSNALAVYKIRQKNEYINVLERINENQKRELRSYYDKDIIRITSIDEK